MQHATSMDKRRWMDHLALTSDDRCTPPYPWGRIR